MRVDQNFPRWRWYAAFCIVSSSAWAQPDATDKQQLVDLIERLESRVTELEAEVSALKANQPQPADVVPVPVDSADVAAEEPSADTDTVRVYWDDGLRFMTEDEAFEFEIGGRLQLDAGWMAGDQELESVFGEIEDRVRFRRARIFLGATLYDDYFFEMEYEFAGGDPEFKDVGIGVRHIPYLGGLFLGHRKEPFSLETLTSDNWIVMLERSLADALSPDRNTGITLANTLFGQRATWAAGIYRESDDFGDSGRGGSYALTARVTGLPWYREDGRKLMHLGAAYSHRNIDEFYRYRSRPETYTTDNRYVDTGSFYTDKLNLYGAEAAFQHGRFSLQGEYLLSKADRAFSNDATFDSWYVLGTLSLTGEHRPYDLDEGVFGRIRPQRNFTLDKAGDKAGWGAWELALRHSAIDLNDGPFLRGGEQSSWTLGLNWYLNPNLRLSWNYVHSDIDSHLHEGTVRGLLTRVQVVF